MKSIPQNLLVLIGCIVVALVILAVFSVYSVRVPPQRQAIHIFDNPNLKLSNPDGSERKITFGKINHYLVAMLD